MALSEAIRWPGYGCRSHTAEEPAKRNVPATLFK